MRITKAIKLILLHTILISNAVIAADAPGEGNATQAVTEINGAGATFPYPLYAKWADAYHKETGVKLNYQSIGSGGGIKQIDAGTVNFGASDKPLSDEDLEKKGLVQFPAVIGGVVPIVNIPGVSKIVLTGQVLGAIFAGKIEYWDDDRIQSLNKESKLPHLKINTIHRSDGSGTTFIFTSYLKEVNENWKDRKPDSTAEWPNGSIGGKGNEGVANMVKLTQGSIGYVEYAYAKQNKLTHGTLVNKNGKEVSPEISTFQASAQDIEWEKTYDYNLINQSGDKAWPLTSATYILIRKDDVKTKAATVKAALAFFDWSFAKGDSMAEDLDYVPLPSVLKEKVKDVWKKELNY